MKKTDCRVCHGKNLQKVLNLGSTPLANSFLEKYQLLNPEERYPLELYFCNDCTFVQLGEIVNSDLLFKRYLYASSTSPSFVKHFEDLALLICNAYDLPKGSLVVDIGSNDGILLKPFKKLGMKVLGIDPAINLMLLAEKQGIETLPRYFDSQLASEIKELYGPARIITATSVFSHVDDLADFLSAVKLLLDDCGHFVIEVYSLASLIQNNSFDTIYHEHLSYFSIRTIVHLLERNGLKMVAAGVTDTHGGSLRIISRKGTAAELKREHPISEGGDLDLIDTYLEFGRRINKLGSKLKATLKDIKSEGKMIAGYGAPAKSTTLLNYFEIGPDTISYIVDDSPIKQNLFTPGTHIPIVSSADLRLKKPDYILILAWNFAEQIMKKLREEKYDGRFIVPIPDLKIVE